MSKPSCLSTGAMVLLLVLSGCDRASRAKNLMKPTFPDESLLAVRAQLLDGMVSYMREVPSCGYTQEDIDDCASILDKCLGSLASGAVSTQAGIRNAVKEAVLDLNALNKKCDGGLIETDQREHICHLLLASARGAGLDTKDDITFEWRDW